MFTKIISKNEQELKAFIAGMQTNESLRASGGQPAGYGGSYQPQAPSISPPAIGCNYPITREKFDGAGVEVGEQFSITLITGVPMGQQQQPVSVLELIDGFLYVVKEVK